MLHLLETHFGHRAFRPGQEALISALLKGQDVLGVMPTGAGKSVCFQLPALMQPGLALVISPLISLMKDQVMALKESGIPAAFINSSLTPGQQREALRRAGLGAYRLMYVAPERLTAPDFLAFAREASFSLIAVDEAHCVSQWGQDFRPSYLEIASFVDSLPKRPPLGAFTATATDQVSRDILRLLHLKDPYCLTTGFDRPNLRFSVQKPRDKMAFVLDYVQSHPGQSGIIYCATRKRVEAVCQGLQGQGILATRYHAGLSEQERRRNQEDFSSDTSPIMVATNAFGMGIDKSNVGFVIHYNMPKDVESYYQEAGRAGRDGEAADCILLYSPGDVQTARFLIKNGGRNELLEPEEARALEQAELLRLERMVDYCKAKTCLRAKLLGYFGQSSPKRCDNCGSCKRDIAAKVELKDITDNARLMLETVAALCNRFPRGLGLTMVSGILSGSKNKRLLEMGLDHLPGYGRMKGWLQGQIKDQLDTLIHHEYLQSQGEDYPTLVLGPKAGQLLKGGEKVLHQQLAPSPTLNKGREGFQVAEEGLFARLRAIRLEIAREAGVPAFVVFPDASLRDMAKRQPQDLEAFRQVSGVGAVKAQRYGELFLAEIQAWLALTGEDATPD